MFYCGLLLLKMEKILVFVSTLDGKTTKWDSPLVRSWSSPEDQAYFSRLWKESELAVIGRSTFEADPIKPAKGQHIVVMTRNAHKYARKEAGGQIEFTDESPKQLVKRFEQLNKPRMLIAGGAHLATSFLQGGLIDELWLTIEPKIFGSGNGLVARDKLDIQLKLISCEKLNDAGTILAKYAVVK